MRSRPRSPTREPPDHVFFTDRSIDSATFADPLIAAGFKLERFPFRHDAPDEEWIAHCAKRGWIGLSADKKITRRPHEMEAVMESGAALFVLKTTIHTNHQILAENFLRTADAIVRFYQRHPTPFIASVTRPNEKDWQLGKPGTVRMWRTHRNWLDHRHLRR
jgi:hypothetical protein